MAKYFPHEGACLALVNQFAGLEHKRKLALQFAELGEFSTAMQLFLECFIAVPHPPGGFRSHLEVLEELYAMVESTINQLFEDEVKDVTGELVRWSKSPHCAKGDTAGLLVLLEEHFRNVKLHLCMRKWATMFDMSMATFRREGIKEAWLQQMQKLFLEAVPAGAPETK